MSTENKTADEGSEITNTTDNADLQTEIEKLRAKNRELLAEKQKAKLKAQEAEAAADEAATQAAERNGDIEALKAAHKKEIDKLTSERDAAASDLKTVRVDNEITRALAEGKVFDHMLEPLTYQFKAMAKYENGVAEIDGKPLGQYITEYLGGEVGSHFRRGSTSSGAGASGNTNSTVYKDHGFTKENFSSREGDFLQLAKTEPAKAKAIAIELDRHDLASDL